MDDNVQKKTSFSQPLSNKKPGFDKVSLFLLTAIFTFVLFRFGRELVISLKDVNFSLGISNSIWVGLENYSQVILSYMFKQALINTLGFNILFSIMIFGFTLVLGYIITSIPKRNILRDTLAILCILPLFLPAEIYVYWIRSLMGTEIFLDAAVMRFLHPLFSALKYVGIPVLVLHILDETYTEKDTFLPLKMAGLFAIVTLAFVSNSFFSLTRAIDNPLIHSTTLMLDSMVFNKGMGEMNIGVSSALGVIQTILTLLSFVILFVPIKLIVQVTFKKERLETSSDNIKRKLVASIAALCLFAVIYFAPYIFNGGFYDINRIIDDPLISVANIKGLLYRTMIGYFILSAISALIAAVIAVIAGKGFGRYEGKIAYIPIAMLLVITIITAKPFSFSQYLFIKDIGALNTGFSIIIATCFSATAIWAVAGILRYEKILSTNSLLLALLAVFLVQTAFIYSNSMVPLIYISRRFSSPILMIRDLASGVPPAIDSEASRKAFNNTVGLYGFIVSLPSLLLFLVAKTCLPKVYLISVISGSVKN